MDRIEHAGKQSWSNFRHYGGICLKGNEKTTRNMLRWPESAPRTGLWPDGIRSRIVTHPTPAFSEKSFITRCRISYLRVLDRRVSGGHAIVSQTKSCAVDTNHEQHCLSVFRLREFRTRYEVISLCGIRHAKKRTLRNTAT